jgi:hypothetical protein
MTDSRSYGKLYDAKKGTKEIAEIVRRQIRLEARMGELPAGKWSVTMDRYAGGSSITIRFVPPVEDDERFAQAYYERERIVHEAERPFQHTHTPYRSRFGQLLNSKLERMLAEHNHDGSDSMRDIYDVKFAAHVNVAPRTEMQALVELYRGGCLPERTVAELSPHWGRLLDAWQKDEMSRQIVQAELRPFQPEIEQEMRTSPTGRHLRLVPAAPPPPSTPVQDAHEKFFSSLTDAERQAAQTLLGAVRRRRSIAVPVEEPVPTFRPPANAWERLALAAELKLDFTIPGLGGRSALAAEPKLDFTIPGLGGRS